MRNYRILIVTLLTVMFVGGWQVFSGQAEENKDTPSNQEHDQRKEDIAKKSLEKAWTKPPLELEVVLQKIYIDGQMSEERRNETVWSLEDFWAAYDGWKVVNQQEGQIVFHKKVKELSPLIKAKGYIGLDEHGKLSIFEGKPSEQKVIQTFYQIDLDELEVMDSLDLEEGIKIKSADQYFQILKQFEKLSVKKP
ncbi:BofC C-terminal domain-containing protein [Pontibacillus sp. HMF3514]|uniref:BofC C-terminal domain-containing protein n=1 Tax=Pontibacillus sp. HMF3514 TaxID=2692425 RepID=UPI00132019F3|nr:BofC C-terminal domain-containing protein [Pontibacillus sp. HMF3514]QHE53119.1 regulator [Pontibacillus sp. HMF3514]